VCPVLQRCEWLQLGIDSEGNDLDHNFVILEEEGNRVVKAVMESSIIGIVMEDPCQMIW
jgi:hypothetical protein